MWLVNCSEEDIKCLFFNKIHYEKPEEVQAMQYQNVVRVCYTHGINSGKMWQSKWRELEREEFLREEKNKERLAEMRKESRLRRFLFMKWAPPTDQTLIPSLERRKKPIKNFFGRVRSR